MKTSQKKCTHHNTKLYGVQKLGNTAGIVLYNCPDCKTTVSEQHLFAVREAEALEAKLAVA